MMKRAYYSINPNVVTPRNFLQLGACDSTNEFLKQAKYRHSATKDAMASLLKSIGYSLTDANGMVDRGRMFLLSQEHLQSLFHGTLPSGNLLLDVGAGDGGITSHISHKFNKVIATEFSIPMQRRLRQRGYYVPTDDEAVFSEETLGKHCMDMILLLNVLDRADKPVTLLKRLHALLKPDTGKLVIAVVLPWCPFVEKGKRQHVPAEKLNMKGGLCKAGDSFEDAVRIMVENVFEPLGFEVETWSKLPYISEGDAVKDFYVLEDALFVLKPSVVEGLAVPELVAPGILETDPSQTESSSQSIGVADWLAQKLF